MMRLSSSSGVRAMKSSADSAARRAMHEMEHREDPRLRERLVVLGRRDAVMPQEIDDGAAHQRGGALHVVGGEVDIRQPHVRAMGKVRGRIRARFERRQEFEIALRYFVFHDGCLARE